jgi:hypothetical protein
MVAWITNDWITNDWIETDGTVVTPPQPLPTVILQPVTLTMLGPSLARLSASVVGTAQQLEIPHMQPRGPYGTEVLVALTTPAGMRVFGFRVVSEMVQTTDIGRYDTLRAVDPIEFGPGGRSSDVLGHIGLTIDPQCGAEFDNLNGFWSQLWANEVILTMPVGQFLYLGGPPLVKVYVGIVQRMVLKKSIFRLEWGPGSPRVA